MTENEAIMLLSQMYLPGFDDEEKQALSKAIETLQEIQQYRAIGTVDECWEARERQRANKPIKGRVFKSLGYYQCPICGGLLMLNEKFCSECGQFIDWSE